MKNDVTDIKITGLSGSVYVVTVGANDNIRKVYTSIENTYGLKMGGKALSSQGVILNSNMKVRDLIGKSISMVNTLKGGK
jgi:hypothetical protein